MRTKATNTIRIGVIGFGRLGMIHARNIAASKVAELYAVCDVSQEALHRAESAYGVMVFEDLNEFLSLPLDGVVIASGTSLHLTHILSVAKAGMAIFTEKPVGLTLEATDMVLQQVVDAGVPFQIGFQRRWDPRYLQAKQIIDSGQIGVPVLFKAYGRDPDASNPANWGLDKNGGLFLNAAIHDYDAARFLMGSEVEKISATGAALVYEGLANVSDIDTCATTLFMTNSVMAITEWSRYAVYGYDIGAEIIGTGGMVQIGREQSGGLTHWRAHDEAPTVLSVFADAYKAEIDGFIASIAHKLPTTPGIEDARTALHMALLARESYRSNAVLVTVPQLKALQEHIG